MSDIAIRCEGLSKRYRLGERESYKALRDVISDAAAAPFRRLRTALSNGSAVGNGRENGIKGDDFWALSDVSFEVKRGEVVGIIGRNGAGKSTLLKILSRITKPTSGHAEIHGRVGSLLEVGTGFHPELSGRENIFLNGAILGMRKTEIERKFDEIVAFAEIEKFIDTPVKRYSSGMYVRLAFAVAAHLEPEILVVDEVLAVGDAAFQKKCLGRMGEVAKGGRTVLFVSHNMEAILRLCTKGILLEKGCLVEAGAIESSVKSYARTFVAKKDSVSLLNLEGLRFERQSIRLVEVRACDKNSWQVPFAETLRFKVVVEAFRYVEGVELGVALMSSRGFELASSLSSHSLPESNLDCGRYVYTIEYPNLTLVPGIYQFGLGIRSTLGLEDHVAEAFEVEVISTEASSSLKADTLRGAIVPEIKVRVAKVETESVTLPGSESMGT